MSQPRIGAPFVIAAATGAALWLIVSVVSGRREAWDTGVYWTVGYPIAIGLCGLLGFVFPRRPWRWSLTIFFAQFATMAVRNGELGNLWPLGLALFGTLSL